MTSSANVFELRAAPAGGLFQLSPRFCVGSTDAHLAKLPPFVSLLTILAIFPPPQAQTTQTAERLNLRTYLTVKSRVNYSLLSYIHSSEYI